MALNWHVITGQCDVVTHVCIVWQSSQSIRRWGDKENDIPVSGVGKATGVLVSLHWVYEDHGWVVDPDLGVKATFKSRVWLISAVTLSELKQNTENKSLRDSLSSSVEWEENYHLLMRLCRFCPLVRAMPGTFLNGRCWNWNESLSFSFPSPTPGIFPCQPCPKPRNGVWCFYLTVALLLLTLLRASIFVQ